VGSIHNDVDYVASDAVDTWRNEADTSKAAGRWLERGVQWWGLERRWSRWWIVSHETRDVYSSWWQYLPHVLDIRSREPGRSWCVNRQAQRRPVTSTRITGWSLVDRSGLAIQSAHFAHARWGPALRAEAQLSAAERQHVGAAAS